MVLTNDNRVWLRWVRSTDEQIEAYRIEEDNGTAWRVIGRVADRPGQWIYQMLSGVLADLTTYRWRVIGLDAYGNASEPLEIGPEAIVRTPDAPSVTVSYDEELNRVTVS
jgi:hypothetical protein